MPIEVFTRDELPRLLEMRVYPGMIEPESRILRAFLARHGDEYDELRFNDRVGEGVQLAQPASEADRLAWERRTQARPDCIAWKAPHFATVIEVKEQARLDGIWQVQSYVQLYTRAHPSHAVRGAIVCEALTPNARALAGTQGIEFYIYTFAAAEPLRPAAEEASV
jgi:Endonuclease NucS